MVIRKATKNDLNGIINLYHQLLNNDDINVNVAKTIFQKMIDDDNYYVLVVEENKSIVSTCTLIIVYNITHRNKPFCIIENVVTDERCRGNGYGKEVIKAAINLARIKECHKIMIQTRKKERYVINFYKKCGFSMKLSKGFMIDLEV